MFNASNALKKDRVQQHILGVTFLTLKHGKIFYAFFRVFFSTQFFFWPLKKTSKNGCFEKKNHASSKILFFLLLNGI